MAKAFISDAEMSKLEAYQPKKKFISDEEMSALESQNKPEEKPWYDVSAKGLLKSGLSSLPILGAMGGGILGTPADVIAGPFGTVGGAGLGAAAGKSLQTLGEKYLLGEDVDREKLYAGPVEEGLLGATGEGAGKLIGKGLTAAAESPLGKKALGLIGKVASKVGEAFTGVSEKEIQTYAKNADKIKNMAKASDSNVAEAADQIRSKFADSIDATRKKMNEKISGSLANSKKFIKSEKILGALDEYKSGIDADLYPEALEEIDGLIAKVSKLTDAKGNIPISRANALKKYLQDEASIAYRNPGQGKIGTEAANAAKAAAAEARGLINKQAPSIAAANKKLAELHDIEDILNVNLIREGKPEAGLLAAGSGGNLRNAKNLTDLGKLTGTDMLGEAENLAAMRTFGSPKLIAADVTGKSAARMGLAAALGYVVGNVPGAAVATALTSPAALKAAIDAGQLSAKILKDPVVMRAVSQGATRGLLNGK